MRFGTSNRRMLLAAAALLVALAAMLGTAGAASAACETGVVGAIGTTKTFSLCSGEQSYVLPVGVTQVRVVAIGGRGGNRFGLGGLGGRVESIVDVPVGTSTLFRKQRRAIVRVTVAPTGGTRITQEITVVPAR
jgi:hypothetical protein